jgi:hypothetical protein
LSAAEAPQHGRVAPSNVITARTRTLVMANFGAVLSVAVVAFGAARLT